MKYTQFSAVIILSVLYLIVLSPIINAQDKKPVRPDFITMKTGYILAARKDFRDLYNGHFNVEFGLEKHFKGQFSWGCDIGYKYLRAPGFEYKYRGYYLSGTVIRTIINNISWLGALRGGIGYSMRTVSVEKILAYDDNDQLVYMDKTTTDWAPMAFVGCDIMRHFGKGFYIGGSFVFDYYYDAHPETGDFGNTGGYNFRVVVAQKI